MAGRVPFALAAAVTLWLSVVAPAHAAISLGPSGSTPLLKFDALPAATEFATATIVGGAADLFSPEALDAAVQLNSAAGIYLTLATTLTVPPAANAIARWNSTGRYLQTRPAGNAYTLLMATLQNNTGFDQQWLFIGYDWDQRLAGTPTETIPGHRVYYSMTGEPDSWILIPDLSASDNSSTAQRLNAAIHFDGVWPAGALLYVLWADDNGPGTIEGGYTIDNAVFATHNDPVIAIIEQPRTTTVFEGDSVAFNVVATGAPPLFYQWFKDGAPIAGATNTTHTIPLVRRSDEAGYYVEVRNATAGPVRSSTAGLKVLSAGPPRVRCVYGTNDGVTLFVVFSQIVTNGNDAQNYLIVPAEGGDPLTVNSAVYPGGGTQGAVVVLTLDSLTPLAAATAYNLSVENVFNRVGDPIDPVHVTPLSLYPERIFTISNHVWKYNDSGNDLGTSWKEISFNDDTWPSGLPLFGFDTAPLPEPLRTQLSFNNSSGAPITTYYFRTLFNHSGLAGEGVLRFRTVLDDAAAIYLNGQEVFRIRLPEGPIDYLTSGTAVVPDAAYEGPFTVCVSNLISGDNVLAVEVHQTGPSADLVFGMELFSVSTDPPPACFRQPTNQVVEAAHPVSFIAEWLCGGSTIAYQWFKDGAPISGATNPIYSINFARPSDAGDYYLVVSNALGSVYQTDTAHLTVLSCCAPQITSIHAMNRVIALMTNTIVTVVFDELTTNGLNLSNFRIAATDGSHELTIESSEYTSFTNTGNTLLLKLDPTTPFRTDVPYNLHLQNIEDLFENRIDPITIAIPRFPSLLMSVSDRLWKYEISGTDLADAWYRLDYDDTAWPSGFALFDAKRPPREAVYGEPVRTQTTISNSTSTAQIPAQYFRTRFNYAGPASNTICIRPFIDDGAVFYLNGREILRVAMPLAPAAIYYHTLATRTIGDAYFEGPFYVGVTNLVHGENLLAVEVHQSDLTSGDLTFGMELGLLSTLPPRRLNISNIGTHIVLTWGGSAVLEQNNSLDPAGWTEVEGAVSGYTTPRTGVKFFRLRE